jgi:hypothetical protein
LAELGPGGESRDDFSHRFYYFLNGPGSPLRLRIELINQFNQSIKKSADTVKQRLFSTGYEDFGQNRAVFQTGAAAYSCGARYGGSETLIAPPFIIRLFKDEARTDEAGAFEVTQIA